MIFFVGSGSKQNSAVFWKEAKECQSCASDKREFAMQNAGKFYHNDKCNCLT